MAFLRAGAARRMRSIMSVMVVVLLLLSTTGVAGWFLSRPDPTHVTTLSDDGPGSLRQAIALAPSKGTITFDASLRGTILLTSGDLNIAKDLTIRGPGAGKLSISSGKSGHIVLVVHDTIVAISGLTFKDSKTLKPFIDNEGTLILSNSTVSGNTVTNGLGGGGISNSGTLTLSNSTVSDNTAFGLGGIYNGGTLTLSNSTISGNTGGGGIYNGSTLTLSNSTISGNSATSLNLGGGGIYTDGTLTVITNSTISDNTTSNGPGGGIYNQGPLTLSNSTVSGNTATGNGGGIFIIAQVDLTFSTIYGNTAHGGGDIAIDDVAIDSNGNSKAIKQLSQVKISNSIVAGDPAHPGPDIVGVLTSYGYNLFQDTSGATFDPATRTQHGTDKTLSVNDLTKLFADPVRLQDNGGPTKTLALAPDSPAVDQIPLAACHITVPSGLFFGTPKTQYAITTDQRGHPRPDGSEDRCDIGAYESSD